MKDRKKKFSKVFAIGVAATAVDYTILNVLAVALGIVPLFANLISSVAGSYASYKLNKSFTYEGRMHGRKKTLVVYAGIVMVGILLFQMGIFYLVNSVLDRPTEYLIGIIDNSISIISMNESIVRLNLAKVCATVTAGLWSYLMMRRFVYAVTKDERHDALNS